MVEEVVIETGRKTEDCTSLQVILIFAFNLRLSGGLQMSVYPEVYEIGPYTVLTTGSGDPIRTGTNEIIIARG